MLNSPFLRRFLLLVLMPTLVALITVVFIASLNTSELKFFSGKMYSGFALSNWEQLSETYLAQASVESAAITRDREALTNLVAEDVNKLSENLLPTYNRLKASNTLDGLYVYNLSAKLLFAMGGKIDDSFSKIASEVIVKTRPLFRTMLNGADRSLQYGYAFPLYDR